jgi:TetR/AcrR family transcriptional repressor of nem operon
MARPKAFDRKSVLQKAMVLFWKKGFHATSIQDLVDELGINRASLYDTFGGKTRLYQEAISLYQEINQVHIKSFLFRHPDVRTGFKELFEETIRQSISDPDKKGCFIVNSTTEMASTDPMFTHLVQQNQAAVEHVFYEYLSHGISENQFQKQIDPIKTATYLYTMNSGLMVLAKITPDKEKLNQVIETALDVLS